MNRFFKRLERFGKSFSARRSQGLMNADAPRDVPDGRSKSSGPRQEDG